MAFKEITIKEALENIHKNYYVLPTIQREFVWNPYQIEKLFDSILQGYTISSMMFWKIEKEKSHEFEYYKFIKKYSHFGDKRFNKKLKIEKEEEKKELISVFDGQQRLTALNIGFFGSFAYKTPKTRWNNENNFKDRFLYINLLNAKNENDDSDFEYSLSFKKRG